MNIKLKLKEFDISLIISEELIEKIQSTIKIHYPKEFGGIYIGRYSEDKTSLEIIDIILPKKFRNSGFLFLRYPRSLNKEIKKFFLKSEGKEIYVGEWHSHPNGTPEPSNTDVNTMIKIANYKKVNIKYPILSIFSFNGKEYNFNFFLTYNKMLYKYEKS